MTTNWPANSNMGSTLPTVWSSRFQTVVGSILDFLFVVIIYLGSELVIWGLSFPLSSAKIEFFAPILSMSLVFIALTGIAGVLPSCNRFYETHIKPRINFINSHLGIGFPVPIVMINQAQLLNGKEIAKITGAFIIANVVSWTLCFVVAYCTIALGTLTRKFLRHRRPTLAFPYLERITGWERRLNSPRSREPEVMPDIPNGNIPAAPVVEFISKPIQPIRPKRSVWHFLSVTHSMILSLVLAIIIGVPIAATTRDHRFLDGCILWCVWVTMVKMQRGFKNLRLLLGSPRIKTISVTIMNPVLMTTLAMIGYFRLKAVASKHVDLLNILHQFSRGTPLYVLWTSSVKNTYLPTNPDRKFGAGDAGLSVLECGIVIWGGKLFECRRQLFSLAGFLSVLVSALAAAGNVFLSAYLGRALGLDTPETLALTARSTTLALAKPAMEAVGGNTAINAVFVVVGGILGQLMYPYLLTWLDVKQESDTPSPPTASGYTSSQDAAPEPSQSRAPGSRDPASLLLADDQEIERDDPTTIAAGIATGINGAAMGVAYLYETKSRAAPYSVLAMTVFGIMTVVFTTVEPMKSTLISLASYSL